MTRLNDVRKSMKKKLSLGDYQVSSAENTKPLKHQNIEDSSPVSKEPEVIYNDAPAEKKVVSSVKLSEEKFRTTVYLPKSVNHMLNEIYSQRLLNERKTDKSSLMCEAIRLLHEKEILLSE